MLRSLFIVSIVAIFTLSGYAFAQPQPQLLFSLSQVSGKTYCFDNDSTLGLDDPRRLLRQSDRDSIRVALGSSGMTEAVSERCDYLFRYSVAMEQVQDIEMQPINIGPGPYWGAYPYGPGRYPGWGGSTGVAWVPVVVIRQRYQLVLDLFLNQQPAVQVYQGRASSYLSEADSRMMITNLAGMIMGNFPTNNLMLSNQRR